MPNGSTKWDANPVAQFEDDHQEGENLPPEALLPFWATWADTPACYEDDMADLVAFVGHFVARYGLDGLVPACWQAHPAMAEELAATWRAWLVYAAEPKASAALLDWHERIGAQRSRLASTDGARCAGTGRHVPIRAPTWSDSACYLYDAELEFVAGTAAINYRPHQAGDNKTQCYGTEHPGVSGI
ncbi:MAG: hypothetical protein ACRDWV_10250 [Acidimicrobiales bacterium]